MGTGVVNKFVDYLKKEHPDLKGFERRTIYRMVNFYDTYSSPEFVSALPTQINSIDNQSISIVSASLTQLEDEKQIISFLSLIN